jgi:subtilase family serine protease
VLPVLVCCSLQIINSSIIGPKINDSNIFIPQSTYLLKTDLGVRAHTNYLIYTGNEMAPPNGPTPLPLFALDGPLRHGPPGGYSPANIRAAYNVPANGGANAIAIVDAYHYGSSLADFNTFCAEFGLPQETSTNPYSSSNQVFQVVYQGTTQPPASASWAQEEALDIEWAHSMAPNAKIYLVEANSDSFSDLYATEQVASALPGVKEVSNSWGGSEFSGENSYDSYFVKSGVVFFASSGDSQVQEYPSTSPNVVSVGGTSLTLTNGVFTSETAWYYTGGGPSAYESRPSYQNAVQSLVGSVRGDPDISATADPNKGVAVYDSIPYMGHKGWMVFGGTSVACPVCAGIANTAATFRASSVAELSQIYSKLGTSNFRDIVSGNNSVYSARVGWDFVTGVGAPLGIGGL